MFPTYTEYICSNSCCTAGAQQRLKLPARYNPPHCACCKCLQRNLHWPLGRLLYSGEAKLDQQAGVMSVATVGHTLVSPTSMAAAGLTWSHHSSKQHQYTRTMIAGLSTETFQALGEAVVIFLHGAAAAWHPKHSSRRLMRQQLGALRSHALPRTADSVGADSSPAHITIISSTAPNRPRHKQHKKALSAQGCHPCTTTRWCSALDAGANCSQRQVLRAK